MALAGFQFNQLNVRSVLDCMHKCKQLGGCDSINFHPASKLCQLNSHINGYNITTLAAAANWSFYWRVNTEEDLAIFESKVMQFDKLLMLLTCRAYDQLESSKPKLCQSGKCVSEHFHVLSVDMNPSELRLHNEMASDRAVECDRITK
ncbi:hypothetical protein HELRODRAFT_175338 [Helobdella robusta]|uniref:Apple domain-containing protein n=1 Tax=Helobdella robusta TaxID=6412 RepID=T1F960_HELRO|nr:hypothetical protein HELRODRAFT_175338 [Helobdella robusta]ESO00845.1 hypothetical protein HELRODRAFT_175338 [Helobdella robusta]